MKNLVVVLAVLILSFASAQGKFEQTMGQAMKLWGEGKNTEASDLFARIASAEKSSWLPNYYVAAVNCFGAFSVKDKEKMSSMLNKAQDALDVELAKNPNNVELLVMQAMIQTAWISSDPMTNGMKLSGKVMELYGKAAAIDPTNPRVVFGKAEFGIGGASFTGANVKELCKDIDRSIVLFNNFKAENPFSPSWGLDRALAAQKNCK
jgi:hypothetical protein